MPTSERSPLGLALIYGGRSEEHDVSVVSARSVARALNRGRYRVVPMAIDRSGSWADPDCATEILESSGDRTDEVVGFIGTQALDPRLLDGSVDVAFPVLHGPYGEDGTIQGLLEMLGLPYVGCDLTSSVVCMDKLLSKRLLVEAGLPCTRWIGLDRRVWDDDRDGERRRCLELGLPLFVKPSRLGSSVGISKVGSESELDDAVERAFGHDHRLIVELGIDAREIEVAVLGAADARASVPGEVVPGHEFYDYEDKYVDDACELLAPAPLDEDQQAAARALAVEAYRAHGCDGMARVDLLMNRQNGRFLVNELNTIPGFTSISMYPRLWELSGLSYPNLLDELVQLALARHASKNI